MQHAYSPPRLPPYAHGSQVHASHQCPDHLGTPTCSRWYAMYSSRVPRPRPAHGGHSSAARLPRHADPALPSSPKTREWNRRALPVPPCPRSAGPQVQQGRYVRTQVLQAVQGAASFSCASSHPLSKVHLASTRTQRRDFYLWVLFYTLFFQDILRFYLSL